MFSAFLGAFLGTLLGAVAAAFLVAFGVLLVDAWRERQLAWDWNTPDYNLSNLEE